MKSRSFFTLVEMLLVLFLLTLIGSVVGISINKSMKEGTFKASVSLCLDQLRLGQELMMLGSDCTIQIEKEGTYKLVVKAMQGVDELKVTGLEKPLFLEGVEKVIFHDAINDEKTDEAIVLKFLSKGAKMPKGSLTLMRGNLSKTITLAGFPSFIGYKEGKIQTTHLSEEIYPYERS